MGVPVKYIGFSVGNLHKDEGGRKDVIYRREICILQQTKCSLDLISKLEMSVKSVSIKARYKLRTFPVPDVMKISRHRKALTHLHWGRHMKSSAFELGLSPRAGVEMVC